MRARFYDISSLLLIALSIYFFYQAIAMLAANDYVGSIVVMLIGFTIIRVGVELSRIAVITASDQSRSPS